MRVAIVCPRGKVVYARILAAIRQSGFMVTEILTWPRRHLVHACKRYSNVDGIFVKTVPTDWKKHGRDAPLERDRVIVAKAQAVIAVWDGADEQVRTFLALAASEDKPIHIFWI